MYPMKRKSKRWLFWVGLLISAVFLFLAFRKIDYPALWESLREIRWWWLLPGLCVYYIGVLVRTWRWQFLLKPLKQVPIPSLFPIVNIGYMGNNVFPLRMGEVLRAVVLKRREDAPISGTLATIVVERIFDAVVVIGFVLLNLGQLTGVGPFTQLGGVAVWAAGIFLFGLVLFILVAIFPRPAQRILHGMINGVLPKRWRKPTTGFADRFLDGLMSLRSPKAVLMILFTSILIWTLETGLYWCVDRALGLELNISQLMLMNGVVNLVLLIPAAPGGLGTFDAAVRAVLEAFGILSEPALGYTLVLRIALWVPITLVGTVYFLREGLKWTTDVSEMQAQAVTNTDDHSDEDQHD
jgi:uncharacterized protein (TIRG00374 family)